MGLQLNPKKILESGASKIGAEASRVGGQIESSLEPIFGGSGGGAARVTGQQDVQVSAQQAATAKKQKEEELMRRRQPLLYKGRKSTILTSPGLDLQVQQRKTLLGG